MRWRWWFLLLLLFFHCCFAKAGWGVAERGPYSSEWWHNASHSEYCQIGTCTFTKMCYPNKGQPKWARQLIESTVSPLRLMHHCLSSLLPRTCCYPLFTLLFLILLLGIGQALYIPPLVSLVCTFFFSRWYAALGVCVCVCFLCICLCYCGGGGSICGTSCSFFFSLMSFVLTLLLLQ